jgi:hypothetical protein
MNESLDFNENSVLALIAVLLIMAIWGCLVVAIDHWVWADRSDKSIGADAAGEHAAKIGALGRLVESRPPRSTGRS